MCDVAPLSLYRYGYIDADPGAAPGSLQRLKWEWVCARMDADVYRRRAQLASADGRLSRRDQLPFKRLLAALMVKSSGIRRSLDSEAGKAAQ